MSKTCLFRLTDNITWVHYSRGRKTVVVRWYADADFTQKTYLLSEENPENSGGLLAAATEVSFAEANALLVETGHKQDLRSLRVDQFDEWREVFRELGQLDLKVRYTPVAQVPSIIGDNDLLAKAIPQTRLRRFYESLRLFSRDEIHGAIAAYFSDPGPCAGTLQILFGESADHFARYENIEQPFRPEKRPWQAAGSRMSLDAKSLVGHLNPDKWTTSVPVSADGLAMGFQPIDYEISLWRTFGRAVFEDGRSGRSSGQGGLDLLLRSEDGGLPIVAEIKAPGDTNLFLGLIQALTYVVELTTASQFKRLKKHYHQFAELESENPRCDVYLVFLDADEPKLIKQTMAVARLLLGNPGSQVAQKVRRIAFVRASLGGDDMIRFDDEETVVNTRT